MKRISLRRASQKAFIVLALILALFLSGCNMKKDDGEKVRDLEFSVVGETEAPQELKTILAEKRTQPFKLTFTDEQNLYIVVGYGPQQTGGYSIQVRELYLTHIAYRIIG